MKKGLVLAFMAVSMMIGGNAIAQNKKECPKSKNRMSAEKGRLPKQKLSKGKNATIRNLAAKKTEIVLIENKTVLV